MFYQAMKIGAAETVGIGWQEEQKYVDNIQLVTAEQIQQVARKYFIPATLTVATLIPKQKAEQKSSAAGEQN